MTRYGLANALFAVALAVAGAVRACRIALDEIDEATSRWTGLT